VNPKMLDAPRPTRRERVIALHCSGASADQWCALAEQLAGQYQVEAPEHHGYRSTGMWSGEHAFTLGDEARRTITLIDSSAAEVHLVGHSYGGGIALHAALARPDRIASMVLYEPTAFHLLRQMGGRGALAYAEIAGVAERVCHGVVTGDYQGALAAFVDYWNGPGAWEAMRPAAQKVLLQWVPKGPLEFQAVMEDVTPACAYGALNFPVLILRGEHAPISTRLIAEALEELLPITQLMIVDGAGHMGPLTHTARVSALIIRHILDAEHRCAATTLTCASTCRCPPQSRLVFEQSSKTETRDDREEQAPRNHGVACWPTQRLGHGRRGGADLPDHVLPIPKH
jgi:pimeloyl-ACP methyl ester carboxylesterase